MPASPWKSFARTEPDRDYLVLLSLLPLRRFSRLPWFFLQTLEIMRQLGRAGGLVGYSLNAQPTSRRFWTLSVWEDEGALQAFVQSPPHARIMTLMAPHIGPTRFVRWRTRGSALPPRWADALGRLDGDDGATRPKNRRE